MYAIWVPSVDVDSLTPLSPAPLTDRASIATVSRTSSWRMLLARLSGQMKPTAARFTREVNAYDYIIAEYRHIAMSVGKITIGGVGMCSI